MRQGMGLPNGTHSSAVPNRHTNGTRAGMGIGPRAALSATACDEGGMRARATDNRQHAACNMQHGGRAATPRQEWPVAHAKFPWVLRLSSAISPRPQPSAPSVCAGPRGMGQGWGCRSDAHSRYAHRHRLAREDGLALRVSQVPHFPLAVVGAYVATRSCNMQQTTHTTCNQQHTPRRMLHCACRRPPTFHWQSSGAYDAVHRYC